MRLALALLSLCVSLAVAVLVIASSVDHRPSSDPIPEATRWLSAHQK